jgi:uncharacterized protein YrrD
MTTWEFKDLQDLPVVSSAAAREMGRVKEVLFDTGADGLFGLVVSPPEKDGHLLLIPLTGIRSIGKDAVTVDSLTATEYFKNNGRTKEISLAGGNRGGMNVMTESGESVGKIDKMTI